jgi:hypothetical protein
MIFPGIPKIPKTEIIVLSVERDGEVYYVVEIHVGDADARRSFRITKTGSEEIELFNKSEISDFLQSKLPAIIKMSGAVISFRDIHNQVTPL